MDKELAAKIAESRTETGVTIGNMSRRELVIMMVITQKALLDDEIREQVDPFVDSGFKGLDLELDALLEKLTEFLKAGGID